MAILPIPTTRVSDYLTRTRLVEQTQSDQLDLFRLQNQISTGRRIFQPSEDGRSALRSITLQRSLERKEQLQINLSGTRASLTSAESSLNGVGTVLNDIRAQAISVAGTTSTEEERLTTRTDVLTALDQLVTLANSQYQEDYLFAGSQSLAAPYVFNGDYVEYRGNETTQQQRVDAGVLFDANVPGGEAFGGLSEPVRGTADLNPQLTADTLLTDLNGGAGLSAGGSLQIAYIAPATVIEAEAVVVNLSSARTIGDVARLIESNGPPTANLRVSVTSGGLEIVTNPESGTPGSIVIREVAGGQTASELGVLAGTPTPTVTGSDLNPKLKLTTQLGDLLGRKASGRLALAGSDNDIVLTANTNGTDRNNLSVVVQEAGTAGATFTDGSPPTLTIDVVAGVTTASEVVGLINAEGTFSAAIDYRDATQATTAGAGVATAGTSTGVTAGGSGASLDLASGLQVTNGDAPFTIDTSSAQTVEDLLNLLNRADTGLFAEVNATGTGIDIRTRRSGADFSIGENGGQLAQQLGVRTYTADSRLEDFNRGAGVVLAPLLDDQGNPEPASVSANRFTISLVDQGVTTTYEVDLNADPNDPASTDATTVNDVLQRIAADTGGAVTAALATTGNGITLTRADAVDAAAPATGTFALANGGFDISAAAAGAAGNNADINVVIADGTSVGAVYDGTNTITVTLDITNDPANSQVSDVAAAVNALAEFTTSNVTSTGPAVAAESTVGGALTGGFDTDAITVSGDAAQRIGFFSASDNPQQASSTTASITSTDRNTIEVDSVFNSLLRLSDALLRGEDGVPDIGEAINRLDDDLNRVTAARGEVGSRVRSLDTLEVRLQDEEVELRSSLSDELDVDLTQAISDFTARQFSLEASLQTTASLLQLSILNYL